MLRRGKSGKVGELQEVEMQGGGRRWKARARRWAPGPRRRLRGKREDGVAAAPRRERKCGDASVVTEER